MKPFEFTSYRHDGIVIKSSVRTSDEEYMVVAYKFLNKLMREFARLSKLAFQPQIGADNLSYMFSERRLDSVVLPALSTICKGLVLTELPVERKVSKDEVKSPHGRADYWCIFQDYTFVIEMKGSHDRYDCATIRENSIFKRWGTMVEQLRDISEQCRQMTENTKGVIRLGLHFISSWSPVAPEADDIKQYRRDAKKYANAFCLEIAKRHKKADYIPSFTAIWIIPDEMVNYWTDATYPGVLLIAKVFKPIPLKNNA